MNNKKLIQDAVINAHNGSNYVVETTDFIAGAWYLLESLKKKGLIEYESIGDYYTIHKIIKIEHDTNYLNAKTKV